MSNNGNKKNNGKNGTTRKNGTNRANGKSETTQTKSKRSAAALARRAAKWTTQKETKKAEALAKTAAKRERVIDMFPDIMGLVGAQGFMSNVHRVRETSKTMKAALNATPLFQNADRATVYATGQTVLGHYFEEMNKEKIIETLKAGVPKKILDMSTPYGYQPLYISYEAGWLDVFTLLLEKGANPNLENTTLGNYTKTLFHYIVLDYKFSDEVRIQFLEQLLKHNVDINKRDSKGYSALELSMTGWNEDVAQFLIENGAEMETPNKAGFTAVLTAIARKIDNVLNFMIAKGVNMDKQTGDAILFPLKVATVNGTLAILETVLKHVKDINAKDALGNTALHYAVMTNALKKIEALKKAGADSRIPNKAGQTAFNLAQKLEQKGNSRAYTLLK